jgi:hypothetical protein
MDDAIFSDLPRTTQGQVLAELILFGINRPRLDLKGARLNERNLSGADLSDTDLTGADLTKTDLGSANLKGADLTRAVLDGTVLTRATLVDALLLGTKLANADMDGVLLFNTTFNDVDLSVAKNLNTVRAAGPCSIGLDTVYRSGGKIPESLLRGAGVPESFITFMKSLAGAALEFYSVFISYSTKDQDFADRLYADLQSRCIRCWFAPHDIQGGRKLHEQIEGAIRVYDKLLLILSEASINSLWVKTEIANARAREADEKRQMLFPITLVPFDRIKEWKLFDADRGIDSAREIREYFIPDFSNWKNDDSYRKGFERLLLGLKAGVQEKASG